jgi:hypothetical protein
MVKWQVPKQFGPLYQARFGNGAWASQNARAEKLIRCSVDTRLPLLSKPGIAQVDLADAARHRRLTDAALPCCARYVAKRSMHPLAFSASARAASLGAVGACRRRQRVRSGSPRDDGAWRAAAVQLGVRSSGGAGAGDRAHVVGESDGGQGGDAPHEAGNVPAGQTSYHQSVRQVKVTGVGFKPRCQG